MSKKVMLLLLVLILSIGSTYGVENETFTDVSDEDWFSDDVYQMKALGIINGYSDGTFKPYNQVRRNEFAKLLVKTLQLPTSNTTSSIFTDVPADNWALKYIMAAKNYLTGYQSGGAYYYKPNDPTLREDIIVALVKGLEYEVKTEDLAVLDDYQDANDISENLKPYIATALANNVIQGYEEAEGKTIKPLVAITRAEAAHLLLKVIQMEKITFEDEEKIILDGDIADEEPIKNASDFTDVDLNVQVETTNNGVLLKWTGLGGVKGYKVVASKVLQETLKYPEDGYFEYTEQTMADIDLYQKYHNGNFTQFEPGQTYYFNINLYLSDGTAVPTEGFQVTFPEESESTQNSILLEGVERLDSVVLVWDKYLGSDFKGYKVVASQSNDFPVYPADGYHKYITNVDDTRADIFVGSSYNGTFKSFESGSYTFRITVLTDNGRVLSNPVELVIP